MSKLTDTILLLYEYHEDDITKLAKRLTERRRATWINTLSELARIHGCNQLAATPKGEDAKELARLSREDAQSIANTFNRDVRRQIERIYTENPRANRSLYFKRLEAWAKKRDTWKVYQIGLNTDGTARHYALTRFYQQNPQLSRNFVASGVPPTCKLCIKIFAAGVVDLEYTIRNPLPRHIGCPHVYRNAAPMLAQCGSLWLG
jgi:hypothetical protein